MNAEWRPVPHASGYLVSSDGRVRGPRGRELKPHAVKGGYLRVTCRGRHRLVHVVVAEAFLGPRPTGRQVNHIDGDKTNNGVSNLEYITPSENVRHSLDVLGVKRASGERNSNARLTREMVAAMRADHASGMNAPAIARTYGIDPGHAWRIVTGRAWRNVA